MKFDKIIVCTEVISFSTRTNFCYLQSTIGTSILSNKLFLQVFFWGFSNIFTFMRRYLSQQFKTTCIQIHLHRIVSIVETFSYMYALCVKKYFDVLLTNDCYPFCTIIKNIKFHSKMILQRITYQTVTYYKKMLKNNTVNDTVQYPIRALAYMSSQTLYTILLHNDIFSYLAKNYGFHESSRKTARVFSLGSIHFVNSWLLLCQLL